MQNTLLTGLPLGFQEWLPATQAVTLAVLTFVQEDLPTVSAALLAATGAITWPAGFLGCFLGIWLGDALLYLTARGLGRPILERPWARRFFNPAAVAESERWFAEKGTWLLVSSRFVPGTRLPTYLAAGFLRQSFSKFLLVTGLVVGVWTVAIFTLAQFFGGNLLKVLQRFNSEGWVLMAVIVAGVLAIRLATKVAQRSFRRRASAAWGRWMRWEFWPAWLFYLPVALNYLRLALKYRGFMLPTAANPGIFSGGFVGESKIATLKQLTASSPEFTAGAHVLTGRGVDERSASLADLRARFQIDYPYILKPDVGQRGVGVKLIRTEEQAAEYLRQSDAPLIIQRYAPGPHEAGIFYHRLPGEARGRIFAITEKIFPHVTGDGVNTLEELIWRDPRARLIADKYLTRLGPRVREVVPAGDRVRLVEAGNHAQGCIFQDGAHLCSAELERQIDAISQRLDGFFVGRYDLRFASAEDLRAGRNFQIIELNGAASEATSIYDDRNSLLSAYRTLFQQWEIVFAIGAANRRLGSASTPLALLWRVWRESVARAATYPLAD